jgi:hypothetical protein
MCTCVNVIMLYVLTHVHVCVCVCVCLSVDECDGVLTRKMCMCVFSGSSRNSVVCARRKCVHCRKNRSDRGQKTQSRLDCGTGECADVYV